MRWRVYCRSTRELTSVNGARYFCGWKGVRRGRRGTRAEAEKEPCPWCGDGVDAFEVRSRPRRAAW
jgi:hypothetical protein